MAVKGLNFRVKSCVCDNILPEDDDDSDAVAAAADCGRHVENVSWCLAIAHLNDGLLCIDHQSSVTVCCVSSSATGVTLTKLHNISVDTVPQGYSCICYAALCLCILYCLFHHHLQTFISWQTHVSYTVWWRRLLCAVWYIWCNTKMSAYCIALKSIANVPPSIFLTWQLPLCWKSWTKTKSNIAMVLPLLIMSRLHHPLGVLCCTWQGVHGARWVTLSVYCHLINVICMLVIGLTDEPHSHYRTFTGLHYTCVCQSGSAVLTRVSAATDRPTWHRGSAHAKYYVSHHMVIKPFL